MRRGSLPALGRAVRLLVAYEVRALGEGLAALAARVGPLPGVRPLVPHEVRALAEGLPAHLALVGLGAGVRPQVLGDGRAVIESPAALATLEGPLARVDSLVLREGGALDERLPAVLAHVGLLPRVDFLVHGEVPGVAERLAARAAAADLAALVDARERDLLAAAAGASPTATATRRLVPAAALPRDLHTCVARPLSEPRAPPAQALPGARFLLGNAARVGTAVRAGWGAPGALLPREAFPGRRPRRLQGPAQHSLARPRHAFPGGGGPGPGPRGFFHFGVPGGSFLRSSRWRGYWFAFHSRLPP